MDCLVLPVAALRMWRSGSRLRYQPLEATEVHCEADEQTQPVTVVVGKERREFLVDPFILEESPFKTLINTISKERKGTVLSRKSGDKGVIFVDVDAILFEHMLWLLHNDCSSLFELNVEEIIDFYAQDN